jgi:hypothetical protein
MHIDELKRTLSCGRVINKCLVSSSWLNRDTRDQMVPQYSLYAFCFLGSFPPLAAE